MRNTWALKWLITTSILAAIGCGAKSTKYHNGIVNPPNPPTNLVAVPLSDAMVRLTWNDNSEIETGFQLFKSNSINSPYTLRATMPANTTSYVLSGLSDSTNYSFLLRAVVEDTFSTNAECSATTFNRGFSMVGELAIPGWAGQIKKQGNYLYVANTDSSLFLIDITDPYNPSMSSSITVSTYIEDFRLSENFAYITAGNGGLFIVDISNPLFPDDYKSFNTEHSHYKDIVISGNRMFISNYWDVLIFDMPAPDSTLLIGSYELEGYHAEGIAVSGQYLYVAATGNGMDIVSVANPAVPQRVSRLATPASALDIQVQGSVAYLRDNMGIRIINIANPQAPFIAGNIANDRTHWIYIDNFRLYFDDPTHGGLYIYNISNPAHPAYISFYNEDYVSILGAFCEYPYIYLAKADRDLGLIRYDL